MAKIRQSFVKEVKDAPQERQRLADCGFGGCQREALVKVRGDGNSWVNLCIDHYPVWFTPERILQKRKLEDTPAVAEIRKGLRDRASLERMGDRLADRLEP